MIRRLFPQRPLASLADTFTKARAQLDAGKLQARCGYSTRFLSGEREQVSFCMGDALVEMDICICMVYSLDRAFSVIGTSIIAYDNVAIHAKPMLSNQCLIDWSQAICDWP